MAPELSIEDFMSLPRYQIYTSFQSAGKSTGWIQGRTLPPPPVLRDATELKAQSQSSYGMSAEQMEAEYFEMFSNDPISEEEWENSSIGRRKRL